MFVDYQNVYRGARSAFHTHAWDPHFFGQIDPLKLGLHLASDAREPRELAEVRVYRGLPASARDPKAYGAARRQIAAWTLDDRVKVITRALRYPDGWPHACDPSERPQEKGIDVALALDFAIMGHEKRYDVGIVFSADTDLKPALEHVADKRRAWGTPVPEVAAWSSVNGHSRRLSLPGERKVYCHWVGADTYAHIRDDTDYTQPSR